MTEVPSALQIKQKSVQNSIAIVRSWSTNRCLQMRACKFWNKGEAGGVRNRERSQKGSKSSSSYGKEEKEGSQKKTQQQQWQQQKTLPWNMELKMKNIIEKFYHLFNNKCKIIQWSDYNHDRTGLWFVLTIITLIFYFIYWFVLFSYTSSFVLYLVY